MMTSKAHVSVCVCTYKRQDSLRRLLESLARQETDDLFTYSIVVADNDHLQSARVVVEAFSVTLGLPVTYCVQPRQNIALTRNAAVEHAGGWNTCWVWTPDAYRDRLDVVERACDKVGRDPATVWRSLGLYALAGEDHTDLERRFARMRDLMPSGVVPGTLDEWRAGRLVGTVDELRAQREQWEALGVETLVVGAGPLPFSVTTPDDVELLAHALLPS